MAELGTDKQSAGLMESARDSAREAWRLGIRAGFLRPPTLAGLGGGLFALIAAPPGPFPVNGIRQDSATCRQGCVLRIHTPLRGGVAMLGSRSPSFCPASSPALGSPNDING